MKLLRVLAPALLCILTLSAQAQWQWLDGNGKKVFSDRPPPIEVPEKNILRRPGGSSGASPAASAAPPSTAAAAAPSLPKPSGKDTELEKKKAQADAAEASKKKAEEEKLAAARADNCERARRSITSLQSGVRISQVNSQGEREYMGDEAKAAELQRLQGITASDCK